MRRVHDHRALSTLQSILAFLITNKMGTVIQMPRSSEDYSVLTDRTFDYVRVDTQLVISACPLLNILHFLLGILTGGSHGSTQISSNCPHTLCISHPLGPQIPGDSGSVEIVLFISKVEGIKQEAQGPYS